MVCGNGRLSRHRALLVVPAVVLACVSSANGLQPDVFVVSVDADPSPAVGSSVTVGARIGSERASGATMIVGLFLDRSAPPSAGDSPDVSVEVSLTGDESKYVTFVAVANATPGTWQMYVMVDCFDEIGESDEGNNVLGPVTVQWMEGGPDLVITAVTPTDGAPMLGDTISIQVTVTNEGTRDADFFSVTLFEDNPSAPSPGDEGDWTEYGGPLAAAGATTITFTNVSAAAPDLWATYVIVNNDGIIGEVDPANNLSDCTPVVWRVAGIDLVVAGIAPSEAMPVAGDTISVDVTVFNLGTDPAGAFSVELFCSEAVAPAVGATGDQRQSVPSLASATGTTLTFTGITSPSTDVWNMYAIVDNGEAVSEAGEGNNVGGPVWLMWREPQPDLVVRALGPSRAAPYARSDISVAVTVRNQGRVDAGAFSVELFYDEATAPSAGDPGDRVRTVASLAAGAEATVTFTGISSSAAGTWRMYATVDGGGAVAELDETNNVGGPAAVEWWPSPHFPECGGAGRRALRGAAALSWLLPLGLAGAAVLLRRRKLRQA